MINDRAQHVFRLLVLFWIGVSAVLLVLAYGGFADGWLQDNTLCGTGNDSWRECRTGEPQEIMKIVGWISLGVGVLELGFLAVMSRVGGAGRRLVA